jgi:PPM family protein phosphatase
MINVRTLAEWTEPLVAAFRSDPGRVRSNNEDLPLVDAARGIFGVIDGVGGQAAGEVAAQVAREVILQRLARPLGTPVERVREALAIANNEIFRRAAEAPELRGMACVVTLALVADGTITIGHVGDTRLYKVRPNGLRKLTHDHSPVGEREDARELSESEAMQHPRRNEVFRDLGSAYRDKDEDEFVEVIVEPLEADTALLLCSDGLTDMLTSATIERLIHRCAGNPQYVADALVAAANEAGGKDNVTVVYAESPGFAATMRRGRTAPDPAGETPIQERDAAAAIEPRPSAAPQSSAPAAVQSWGRRLLRRRTTWFSAGALAGVVVAFAVAWQLGLLAVQGRETLHVNPTGTSGYRTIADAMAAARPGSTVQLEPGTYAERIYVKDGVDLAARIPGTAIVTRPASASGEVIAISVFGSMTSSISGLRVESTSANPIDVGVRISRQGVNLSLMQFSGPMRTAVEVQPYASVNVLASHFAAQAQLVTLADESQAVLTSNVMLRSGPPTEVPFAVAPSSQMVLRQNVMAGYGSDLVKGLSPKATQQLLAGNVVMACEPSVRQ